MIKQTIKSIFFGRTFPVLFGNLKGIKLKLNNLLKGSVLIRNYEPDKQLTFKLFLKENNVFFDIGANVGLHSYYVSKNIPSVDIYSFEPLPENAEYIRQTIKANSFTKINLIECAVSSKSGETYFETNTDNSRGNITNSPKDLKVKLISLDDFTQNKNVYPDVLKIDVEGAEGEVLEGARKLIASHKPIFIIELHSPEQDLYVAKFLHESDYEIYRLNEEAQTESDKLLLRIKKLNASWPDPEGVFGSIVAIPKEKFKPELLSYIQ